MVEAKITLASVQGENRQFVAQSGSNHAVVIDDKVGNTGPKPIEMILMGLGGCTSFDVINILRKKRQKVESYQVFLNAEQQPEPPNMFTVVTIKHVVTGEDISAKAVEDAIHLSETKYCAAGAMISKAAKILTGYEIRNPNGTLIAASQADLVRTS